MAERGAYGGGEVTFDVIGERLGISHQGAVALYQRAISKLSKDADAVEILMFMARNAERVSVLRDVVRNPEITAMLLDLSEYHFQLRARSWECQAKRQGYY